MEIKSTDPVRTVEETLPELHELDVCEVLLVRDPLSKGLDSLIPGLLVYSDGRCKGTISVYRTSGTETSSVRREPIQRK